jgi:signal transduction histidine kinase
VTAVTTLLRRLRARLPGTCRYWTGEIASRLADRVSSTLDRQAVLPLMVEDVVDLMGVRYAGVELTDPDRPGPVAECGAPASSPDHVVDLVVRGHRIGRLIVVVGDRRRLSGRERRLLAGLAVPFVVAVDMYRLDDEVRKSRRRLVEARDEERRRLVRELHDGVGPTLAAVAMLINVARRRSAEPGRVDQILDQVATEVTALSASLRRLIDEPAPPLEGGLVAALERECQRFSGPDLAVDLRQEGDLGGLPAQVELAVCRIVAEALTNVTRHARAGTCRVTVRRSGALTIEIIDDGIGIGAAPNGRPGVGLTSMRERAAGLGGECVVAPAHPRGTAVRVWLPATGGHDG